VRYVRRQKLGVVIELGSQVEALIAWPVAIARQSDQLDNPFRRLGWILLEAFDIGMLRECLAATS
jgi:hypothetical protein